jgi:prepilin-type N-terminal cleavage/methylation domain-containing protein
VGCRARRAAFTLIELLVVIVIVGILVAMLLPAVQSARESARRTSCSNKMRQVGLAVLSYLSTHKIGPSSITWRNEGPQPPANWNGRGWIVSILPQLELQNLYDQFRFDGKFTKGEGIKHPDNREAIKTNVPVLKCPSDGYAVTLITEQWQWKGIPIATTNYKGVMGNNMMGSASAFGGTPYCNNGSYECQGFFWRTCGQFPGRFNRVTDGMSHTMMLGEDLAEYNWHAAWCYANGDSSSTYAPLNYMPIPPDPAKWWEMRGFRSRHPGGAQFCFGDAAVRFIVDTIPMDIYRGMSTRNGGELVFDYGF